jgi:hypothetical protein
MPTLVEFGATKARVAPLTAAEWAFFLGKDLAALERLFETGGEQFFWLYYARGMARLLRGDAEKPGFGDGALVA